MGNLFKHKITALNGVLNYLYNKYPDCKALVELKGAKTFKPINDLLKEFRITVDPKKPYSKCIDKNSEYAQKNFDSFINYLKENNGKF